MDDRQRLRFYARLIESDMMRMVAFPIFSPARHICPRLVRRAIRAAWQAA